MTDAAINLRGAVAADMSGCARILNKWIDETPWMPRVHEHADVERHYRETVFAEREILVAEDGFLISGFLALSDDDYITALYIDSVLRNRRVGKRLTDRAKATRPTGLNLWTFQANVRACRFYEREGFKEVRRTDGDNEEGLPDILYHWQGGHA